MNLHPSLKKVGDLLVGEGLISWYGGPDDPDDNGIGAWGFNSKERPYAPYCSLPRVYITKYQLAPGQQVTVEFNGRQVRCFLADIGPGGTAEADKRLIDVGKYVMRRLGCTTDDRVKIYIPAGKIMPKEQWC